MPRDATDTRARILAEAERLFATRGVHQTTTREITEAAGQRNVSAITYHFGSRETLLIAILMAHGDPMDDQRAALIAEPLDEQPTRNLIAALLIPYAQSLREPSGRYYLRIVAQLTDAFPLWRVGAELTPYHLQRILSALEHRTPEEELGRDRVIAAIMLMTSVMAERARQIEDGEPLTHSESRFVSNLADMIVGLLEAPVGAELQPEPQRTAR